MHTPEILVWRVDESLSVTTGTKSLQMFLKLVSLLITKYVSLCNRIIENQRLGLC